jgi:hypothetical protein
VRPERPLKHFETRKLFYNRYKYKLVIRTALARHINPRTLSKLRENLDRLQRQVDDGETSLVLYTGFLNKTVSKEDFYDAKRIYQELVKAHDYCTRAEGLTLSVFSNDWAWLLKLENKADNPRELWKPRKESEEFMDDPNVIIVKTPPKYEYKVTLRPYDKVDPGFADWAEANPDLAKTTKKTLSHIRANRRYRLSGHVYFRDAKVMSLASLMLSKVGRVDKLVYVADKDK